MSATKSKNLDKRMNIQKISLALNNSVNQLIPKSEVVAFSLLKILDQ